MSLVGEFGGTGATFIVPLLLILFMKSKQLKAVGKASIVPVAFAVNEPLLFGAPMILNPYMLIPFVAAGCVNVSVAKFFIDNVGMNGFSFVVPWATPAPIGIFITTNFQLIALVFVAIIILLDAIISLPFLKAYDKLLCDQEAERAAELGLESDGAAAIAANASAPAVDPFEHTSGTSIRGKTRTSQLANREVKVYLTRAAITAMVWDPQLKAYYKKKTGEGKHKASVINAIRAKIIARCFAVITIF